MRVVVKIGTSSLTTASGNINIDAIDALCEQVSAARENGNEVIVVTSAAITAGLPPLGFVNQRPRDSLTLQAAAAVGQSRLLRAYDDALARYDIVGGQILLTPSDFFDRNQYVHARDTINRLISLGVVPIINENDAVADDEIRFGDNDRLAALVAHAINAELLVLLTDMAGLYTADPRIDDSASLVEEIIEIDHELLQAAGGSGTDRGSGGMASKLSAARMAAWTGVRSVIASAERPNVVIDSIAGDPGVGTTVLAKQHRFSARKLWIAFAMPAAGKVVVDGGARNALVNGNRSLLAAGVTGVEGVFDADSGVEIVTGDGEVIAKGVCRYTADQLRQFAGQRSESLPDDVPVEVVHRDDLVVLV